MANHANSTPAPKLSPAGTALTMSSLEIAGLTGKKHPHVLRDADKMLGELGIDQSKFGSIFLDTYGREQRCLNLPKRECLVLVSGYSVELRARIIDRWMQLEAALAQPDAEGLLPEDAELLRRIDGISRMLSHKVTQIEKAIPALISQHVETAILADPRRAVGEYVSTRQLLDEVKVPSKGRNKLNRRLGYHLRTAALTADSRPSVRRCPHSGVWLFSRDFANSFMRARGGQMVREHLSQIGGQGVLRLVTGDAK